MGVSGVATFCVRAQGGERQLFGRGKGIRRSALFQHRAGRLARRWLRHPRVGQ